MNVNVTRNAPVLPASQPASQSPKAGAPIAPEAPKSLGDTLLRSGAGLYVGAQSGALLGGLGIGAYTALTMGSNVPTFHKVLGVIGFGGMGAIGGAAAGAAGGLAAGAFANGKGSGTATGAAAGAILGAAAVSALSIAMKKFEPGTIAAGAAFGAAFGAAGGFASKALID